MGIFCLALRLFWYRHPFRFLRQEVDYTFCFRRWKGWPAGKSYFLVPHFHFSGNKQLSATHRAKQIILAEKCHILLLLSSYFGPRKVAEKGRRSGGRSGKSGAPTSSKVRRNFMPWANKSAKPAGKWPKGHGMGGAKVSPWTFKQNTTQFQTCLIAGFKSGLSQTKDPQKQHYNNTRTKTKMCHESRLYVCG